jgi:hypothetical protein
MRQNDQLTQNLLSQVDQSRRLNDLKENELLQTNANLNRLRTRNLNRSRRLNNQLIDLEENELLRSQRLNDLEENELLRLRNLNRSQRLNNQLINEENELLRSQRLNDLEENELLRSRNLNRSQRLNNQLIDEENELLRSQRLNDLEENELLRTKNLNRLQRLNNLEEDELVQSRLLNTSRRFGSPRRTLKTNSLLKRDRQLSRQLQRDFDIENNLTPSTRRTLLRRDLRLEEKLNNLDEEELLNNLDDELLNNLDEELVNNVDEKELDIRLIEETKKMKQNINKSESILKNVIQKRPTIGSCGVKKTCGQINLWTIKFRLPGNVIVSHQFDKTKPLSVIIQQLQQDLKNNVILISPQAQVINCEHHVPIEKTGIENYMTITVVKA